MRTRNVLLFIGIIVLFVLFVAAFFRVAGVKRETIYERAAVFSRDTPIPRESALPEPPPLPEEPIRIIFGGDLMFDRYIRTQAEKLGKDAILSGVVSELRNADRVVANLEGPITSNSSKSVGSAPGEPRNFLFTFDPEWAALLFASNIQIVNLGNNHILNFGESGLVETRAFLKGAGVQFFGDPFLEASRTLVLDIRGKHVGFVNYNGFFRDGESRALSDIETVRKRSDVVFVYTHWGNEYVAATPKEKRLARLFVDRGADAVIGSHPHVVQERETYKGKTLYYSLGNFVFDQYFRPDVRRGLLVEAIIEADGALSFREMPIELNVDGTTSLSQ